MRVTDGDLRVGAEMEQRVDPVRRSGAEQAHTATHVLHHTLRDVLGEHVRQMGSLVEPGRLRFDFAHFSSVDPDVLVEIEEIINRRVGRNELDTIQACLAIVDAQREYALRDPDGDGVRNYAPKIQSDPGQKNGLYWETAPGEPQSPMGPLVAQAALEGYPVGQDKSAGPPPYHGYRYRLLTAQGPNAPGGKLMPACQMPVAEGIRHVWELVSRKLRETTPEQRTAVIERGQMVRTLRKAIRRTLEHDWEHLMELSRRPGGPEV